MSAAFSAAVRAGLARFVARVALPEWNCRTFGQYRGLLVRTRAAGRYAGVEGLAEVRVLDSLKVGARTIEEVSAACGWRYSPDNCVAGGYLRRLRKRGLVRSARAGGRLEWSVRED